MEQFAARGQQKAPLLEEHIEAIYRAVLQRANRILSLDDALMLLRIAASKEGLMRFEDLSSVGFEDVVYKSSWLKVFVSESKTEESVKKIGQWETIPRLEAPWSAFQLWTQVLLAADTWGGLRAEQRAAYLRSMRLPLMDADAFPMGAFKVLCKLKHVPGTKVMVPSPDGAVLCYQTQNNHIKQLAQLAGLDVKAVGIHSCCRGGASQLIGLPDHMIMEAGRWRSRRYSTLPRPAAELRKGGDLFASTTHRAALRGRWRARRVIFSDGST
mmetsp:Transcript_27669/g.43174  ORF Transcript_27669/g.43174 Transcript_27669/m.43174 type:complete len:270 (+) Transcript_27669:600-1409(+)